MIQRTAYLNRIRPFRDKDVIKILTGMRRSGKSTILAQIIEELLEDGISSENIISMNFESASLDYFTTSYQVFYNEVIRLTKDKLDRVYLFFDEVQMVDSWERAVNSFRVDLNCDIYLTGSNSTLLAGELTSLLGGRYVSFQVQPFSFKEFMEALPDMPQHEAFHSFRTLGGLPFLTQLNFSREDSLTYLTDAYSSIVLNDLVKRKSFRDVDQLERVLLYFMSEIGTTFSVKNIANVFAEEHRNVSRESIYNYLQAAEEAMLLSRVRRYDVMGKELLRGYEKVYITDLGLRESQLGNNEERIDLVLENLVFSELTRREYQVFIGKNDIREIDFIAQKGPDFIYLQVCYLLASESTIEREFGAFANIKDNFPRYVISMDTVDFSRNGIRHFNIESFLLSDEW